MTKQENRPSAFFTTLFLLSLLLAGCAHDVKIDPDVSKLGRPFGAPSRIASTVGYYVSDEQLALSVVTPAGGGDSVKYAPYRDFINGFDKILKNAYEKVKRLPDLGQIATDIDLILLPKISTESSSTSAFFWPPESFTVKIHTSIRKPTGEVLRAIDTSGKGTARMGTIGSNEHSWGRSIAGERAMLDALQKLQSQLLEEPKKMTRERRTISSSGSGFFIAPTLVMTNQHVVDNCDAISIRVGSNIHPAKVRHQSKKTDLALLSTAFENETGGSLRLSPILGEEIMVAGHPLSGILSANLIVSAGNINSLAGINEDPTLIQISAPIQPGNSGGPIFDRSGNIVGMAASKLNVLTVAKLTGDISQNVNFGIKPEILRLFLDNAKVPYKTANLEQEIMSHEIAKKAQLITVQVLCNPAIK